MIASVNGVSKHYGSSDVLVDININIQKNSHIGLIGANGSGKSTLMKIIAGKTEPDGGNVRIKSDISLGYLSQELGLDDDLSVYENALSASASLIRQEQDLENVRAAMERTKNISELEKLSATFHDKIETFEASGGLLYKSLTSSTLKGLGFSDEECHRNVSALSGGQKMRAALAKILITNPDIILLDEPTNYLDLSSASWLENTLSSYRKAFIVVSHDRYFLDKTVNRIWELEDCAITEYKGNYTSYQTQKQELEYSRRRAYDLTVREVNRQKAIIAKLKSFNREKSVKRAESREKLLAKIKIPDKPKAKKVSHIGFEAKDIITKRTLEFENVSVGYDNKAIITHIDLKVATGEKIGICGDNASGKSTIFKTIMSQIPPIEGMITFGSGVTPAHFKQEHEDLNPENTVLEELSAYSGEDNQTIRNLLGSLLFSNDDAFKKIGVLSGGEKSRIAVAKLMLTDANLLLLDEPTNHLDIESAEVFEAALSGYNGTLLVISHDRYLLSKIAERMVFVYKGVAYVYNCGYEKAAEMFEEMKKSLEAPAPTDCAGTDSLKEESRGASDALSKNKRRQLGNRLVEIEARLRDIEAEKNALEEEMNDADFYKDIHKANEKTACHAALIKTYRQLEDEWIESAYLLENNE